MTGPLTIEDETTEPQSLRCMDVWGGNRSIEADVAVTGLDVSIRSRTWRQEPQGGDIYLVSMCGCAKTSRFMLADVAGHGQQTAPLARRLRKLMAKHINKPDQTRLARAINREFNAYTSQTGRFATALLATYHPETDELTLCNAGHPPPICYQSQNARWTVLDPHQLAAEAGPSNLPLGVIPGTEYHQFTIRLAPNDAVLMVSDGIPESGQSLRDNRGGSFAHFYSQLTPILAPPGQPPPKDELYRAVRDAFDRDEDDRTMLVLTHNGNDPPEQSLREKLNVLGRMMGLDI